MNLFYLIYLFFLLIVSLSTLFLAVYALRYRKERMAIFFSLLMLASTGWLWTDLTRALCQSTQVAFFLESKIQYFFIAIIPVSFFLFILDYMGHERWIRPKTIILLCIIPALTQIVSWAGNPGGIEKEIVFGRVDGFLYPEAWTFAPWFWVHMTYSYVLIFIGISMIIANLIQSSHTYRHQSVLLLLGSLMPPLGNVLDTFALVNSPMEFTPVGFAFMGPFFAGALLRYRLLDLKPVARRKLVETMDDPMMAMDALGRIVDLNCAAESIVDIAGKQAIGRPVGEVFSHWPDLIGLYHNADTVKKEIEVDVKQVRRSYELQISPLTDRQDKRTGSLVVLREITARKEAERDRERLIASLQKALSEVKTLSGLIPICSACKKIRDDKGYWNYLEAYIHEHSEATFSHGICPDCTQELYGDL